MREEEIELNRYILAINHDNKKIVIAQLPKDIYFRRKFYDYLDSVINEDTTLWEVQENQNHLYGYGWDTSGLSVWDRVMTSTTISTNLADSTTVQDALIPTDSVSTGDHQEMKYHEMREEINEMIKVYIEENKNNDE